MIPTCRCVLYTCYVTRVLQQQLFYQHSKVSCWSKNTTLFTDSVYLPARKSGFARFKTTCMKIALSFRRQINWHCLETCATKSISITPNELYQLISFNELWNKCTTLHQSNSFLRACHFRLSLQLSALMAFKAHLVTGSCGIKLMNSHSFRQIFWLTCT